MSTTYDIRVLRRIAIFVLNRASQDLHSELYDYLVMVSLSEDKKCAGVSELQLTNLIEKNLGITKLPEPIIRNSLVRLRKAGAINAVHSKGNEIYILSHDKQGLIELMSSEYERTVVGVKEEVGKRLGKVLGSSVDISLENTAFSLFQKVLSTVFSALGEECCYSIVKTHGIDTNPFRKANLLEYIDEALTEEKEDLHRDAEQQVFIEYLLEPDENLRDFLFSLAQSYFIVNVLRLDPECSSCTKESLQRKKVFLDTNVIMHSLTGAQPRNASVNLALKLTSDLGIKILFSKRTKAEYDTLMADARRSYGKNPQIPKARFVKVQKDLSDGLLKDYELKKGKTPNLTFEGYMNRIEAVEVILGNRYSACYDDNDYADILSNPDMAELIDAVTLEGNKFGLYKSRTVAEHDAFHILLIQNLRKEEKGDFLGPDCWFLTHDRSLEPSEKRFGKYGFPTSSIFVDNWVQMLSPLLSPEQTKTAKEAYAQLFASRLPLLSKTIDDDVFLTFQGDWIDEEDLTPQDIANIMGRNYLKGLQKKLEDEKKQLSEEEREMIIGPIVEEVKAQKRNSEKTNTKVKSLGKTVLRLRGDVFQLQKTVYSQSSALKRVGHVVGAFVFILLWYFLFQQVLINYLDPWLAFVGAILIAVIFGYLADFHGYRWLLARLLRKDLPK